MDIPIIGQIFEWLDNMTDRGYNEGWHWLFFALIILFIGFVIWQLITKIF